MKWHCKKAHYWTRAQSKAVIGLMPWVFISDTGWVYSYVYHQRTITRVQYYPMPWYQSQTIGVL